jgi:hypothetical protein
VPVVSDSLPVTCGRIPLSFQAHNFARMQWKCAARNLLRSETSLLCNLEFGMEGRGKVSWLTAVPRSANEGSPGADEACGRLEAVPGRSENVRTTARSSRVHRQAPQPEVKDGSSSRHHAWKHQCSPGWTEIPPRSSGIATEPVALERASGPALWIPPPRNNVP